VTHPSLGTYCITLAAGIDPTSAVLVVGPDFFGNGTGVNDVSDVEWQSTVSDCPAGTLQVVTFVYDGDGVDNVVGTADLPGDSLPPNDEPFAFVVP
jgi:hypothetical protein